MTKSADKMLTRMHVALSSAVRRRRISAGISQARLAELTGSGSSRITKLENCDPQCSFELAIRALLALGATRNEVGKIIGGGQTKSRSTD